MKAWQLGLSSSLSSMYLKRELNISLSKNFPKTGDDDDEELFLWYGWPKKSFISSRDNCQRSLPSRIFDTPKAGFEPEFRLCWMKLCITHNHYTTAPHMRLDGNWNRRMKLDDNFLWDLFLLFCQLEQHLLFSRDWETCFQVYRE